MIIDMPNIGDVLSEKLNSVGIHSRQDLEKAGSKKAFLLLSEYTLEPCINTLYALEGAIYLMREKKS